MVAHSAGIHGFGTCMLYRPRERRSRSFLDAHRRLVRSNPTAGVRRPGVAVQPRTDG